MKKLFLFAMASVLLLAFMPKISFAGKKTITVVTGDGEDSGSGTYIITIPGGSAYPKTLTVVALPGSFFFGNCSGTEVKNVNAPGFTIQWCVKDPSNDSTIAVFSFQMKNKQFVTNSMNCCEVCQCADLSCLSNCAAEHFGGANVNPDYRLSDSEDISDAFCIYPNPSNGIFSVDYSAAITGNVIFKVRDITGKTVFDKAEYATEGDKSTFEFDLRYLNPGVYILEAKNEENYTSMKFIIEK